MSVQMLSNGLYQEFVAGNIAVLKGGEPGKWYLCVKPWGLRWDVTNDPGMTEALARAEAHFAPRYRFSFWRREARKMRNELRRFVMGIKRGLA